VLEAFRKLPIAATVETFPEALSDLLSEFDALEEGASGKDARSTGAIGEIAEFGWGSATPKEEKVMGFDCGTLKSCARATIVPVIKRHATAMLRLPFIWPEPNPCIPACWEGIPEV